MSGFKHYCSKYLLLSSVACLVAACAMLFSLKTDCSQIKTELVQIRTLLSQSQEDSVFTKLLDLESKYYKSINDSCKEYFSKAYSIQSFVFKNYYHDFKMGNHADIIALEIAKDIGSARGLAIDSYNSGNLYLYYEDFSSAAYFYSQAYYNFLKTKEYPFGANLAASKMLLTSIYYKRTADTDSLVNTYRSITPRDNSIYNYICLLDSASICVKNGSLNQALEFAQNAIKSVENQDNEIDGLGEQGNTDEYVQRGNLALAHICTLQKNFGKAASILRKVETNTDTVGDYYKNSLYKKLENCYLALGMKDSAEYYRNQSKIIDDHFESLRLSNDYFAKVQNYNAVTEIQNHNQSIYFAKIVAACFLFAACILFAAIIIVKILRAKKQEQVSNQLKQASTETKYKNSSLSLDDKKALFAKIQDVLSGSEVIFDPDFDVKQLSALVKTHDRWVSQVINEFAGKNFSALLNDYRIAEAKKRIADTVHYGQYTIGAIGESVGFKNRTYFTSVFKKITGLTPSEYHDSLSHKSQEDK